MSWTLSPQIICDSYEKSAPPLKSRLRSIKYAADLGWKIRLCFDPVIFIDNWYEIYLEFISEVFSVIDSDKVEDITLGVFRMNKDFFNRIRKRDLSLTSILKIMQLRGKPWLRKKSKRLNGLNMLTNILLKYFTKKYSCLELDINNLIEENAQILFRMFRLFIVNTRQLPNKENIMTFKLTIFVIGIIFIVGSLVLAIWYRINEDDAD